VGEPNRWLCSCADKWLAAGLALLGAWGAWGTAAQLAAERGAERRRVLAKVLEATRRTVTPFLPLHFDDVMRALHDLLLGVERRRVQALEVCQLLALLLPREKRQRFRALLIFLRASRDVRLSREVCKAAVIFSIDVTSATFSGPNATKN